MQALTSSKEVPYRISTQGAVLVDAAFLARDYGDCLLIHVELQSKYAHLLATGGGNGHGPELFLSAGPETLHVAEGVDRDTVTVVEFHEHTNWDVFIASDPGRYTMAVVIVAPEALT